MDNEGRTKEQFHADCDALAGKMNTVLEGERLTDVATVAGGIAAMAVQRNFADPDERAGALIRLMEFMWQNAGFTCEVKIKWQKDNDETIH